MQSLESVNFRNLLAWYEKKIDRLLHGELATEVFTPSERRILLRSGILQRINAQDRGYGRRTLLSEEALKAREVEDR